MIYLNANRIFATKRNTDPKLSLEILGSLIPDLSQTKLIYVIGDGAETSSSYLSEPLLLADVTVLRCRASARIDAKQKFLINGESISPAELCSSIERLTTRILDAGAISNPASNRLFDILPLSCEELSFLLAAELAAECACDAVIFEISSYTFKNVISKLSIAPLCAVIASLSEQCADELIGLLPLGTKAAVRYSDKVSFDFISNDLSSSNTLIGTVSPNKITSGRITSFGANFFYNSFQFDIKSIEKDDVIFASLAAEALMTLSRLSELFVPYPLIYQGILQASPLFSAELFSISPLIYTKISDTCTSLPDSSLFDEKRLIFIYESDDVRAIISKRDFDVAVIVGSYDFIQSTKKQLTSFK